MRRLLLVTGMLRVSVQTMSQITCLPVTAIVDHSLSSNSSDSGRYVRYDHVTWYVSNAKQAASYFITRMGFKDLAFRGLETGSKTITSRVVSNNNVTFVFTSALRAADNLNDQFSDEDKKLIREIHDHVAKHGDAVSDVAFEVDNAKTMFEKAVVNGAVVRQPPSDVRDSDGHVTLAVIKTFGDVTHTFVERSQYRGVFLPGYVPVIAKDPVNDYLPKVEFEVIDHCVGNQDWNELQSTVE